MAENTKGNNVKKKVIKLDDYTVINVKSSVNGKLIYINSRTHDTFIWETKGEAQQLTIADLRAMKATQVDFFVNNWIFIEGIESEGYESFAPQDVYKFLMVTQYYNSEINPDNFDEMFNWSADEIREKSSKLSVAAKENLIIAINEAVKTGKLDSLSKIKAFEDTLNCVVARPD